MRPAVVARIGIGFDGQGPFRIEVFGIEKLLHQTAHNRRRAGLLQIVSGLDRDKAGVADARRK